MERKNKLTELVSNAGKTAKTIFDSAIQAADQNDDGKFDLSDVSVIADSVGGALKKGTQNVLSSAEEKARILEIKALRPIFVETLDAADFMMPKFIRITERDKKHAESEVCQGSIGYFSNHKDLILVNIFRDSYEVFGLTFFPDNDSEFYYIDPTERDRYIALDEYFGYLKIERVNELQRIAQDLGAKYFKVTYKEEQTSFADKKVKGNAKAVSLASADASHHSTEKKYSTIEVAAEMSFPGHAPIKPTLKYMQRDPSIQNLISMRMDKHAPLLNQKFMLKMSTSSGIKESDAVKIDAVLKGMKCSGNTTVAIEAKNESRRYLEYEIEF
ncbi:MAG: hypothetical protein IJY96_04075 [Oscillospiraceae bacterium]|nr:hypothetical protein [Oscillospiraceae bacterium]